MQNPTINYEPKESWSYLDDNGEVEWIDLPSARAVEDYLWDLLADKNAETKRTVRQDYTIVRFNSESGDSEIFESYEAQIEVEPYEQPTCFPWE